MTNDARARTEQLKSLHVPGRPLILPNAWDVPSARAVVAAGYPVVATGSWAVAETLGYRDGEHVSAAEMFDAARRIAAGVDVPVTLDAESGYGLDPTELVERLLAAGVHGYNLEDSDHRAGGLVEPAVHARRIAALRAAAEAAGVPLVLNARVDVFHDLEDPEAHIAAIPQALDRARRYLDAGADCVYPILASEPAAAAVVAGLPGANINLLVDASADDIDGQVRRATDLGAARISMGPSVWAVQQRSLAALLAGLPR